MPLKILAILFFAVITCRAQTVLNGSFELLNRDSCLFNMLNSEANASIEFINSFGYSHPHFLRNGEGNLDLLDSSSNCTDGIYRKKPFDGGHYIVLTGLTVNNFGYYDVISLRLSNRLDSLYKYRVKLHHHMAKDYVGQGMKKFYMGVSSDSSLFGDSLNSFISDTSNWKTDSFDFISNIGYKFLTVSVDSVIGGSIAIDNITLTLIDSSSGIDEQLFQVIETYPNPFMEEFRIKIKNEEISNKVKVVLYNIYGEQVEVHYTQTQKEVEVEASELTKGIYFVELRNVINGQEVIVGREKIIKL